MIVQKIQQVTAEAARDLRIQRKRNWRDDPSIVSLVTALQQLDYGRGLVIQTELGASKMLMVDLRENSLRLGFGDDLILRRVGDSKLIAYRRDRVQAQ